MRFYSKMVYKDSLKLNRDSIFKLKYLTTRKYTKFGSLLESLVYNSKGNLITKSVFTHNSFHEFLTNIEFKNGSIKEKSYYYYNKDKKLIKVLSFTKDSVLTTENYHRYLNGNMIAIKGVFHKHNSGFESIMTYDKSNNLVKYTLLGFSNSNTERRFKHDKKGRKISEVLYKGHIVEKKTFKYDNQNNLIEEIKKDKLLNLTTIYNYSYQYDFNLNWISKKTYLNKKLKKIELREITYYD